MRANEFTPGNRDLIIFDIDDTLLHTTAKIKVIDANGNAVRELTNQEFNNYNLQPGEKFDFGEFRNAEKFRQESKPIVPMVRKLKTILGNAGNAKVIMLTARADFDDKETFLQTFQDLGIDMSRVHVHRAGNLPGDESPAYKKAVWVRKYLNTRQYGHVRLYDDSMSNLRVFKELKKEYPQVDFRAIYVGPTGSTQVIENQDDEIHNYEKLDGILKELADLVVKGQRKDSDKYGMVAAAVLDNDNNLVKGINLPAPNGKRRHAERVAIDRYVEQYGDIPKGSIIITTCSPCSEHMDERYGEDCTELINQHGVKKVYAGYMDPTQEEEHRDFNIMETEDSSIRDICKEFADTFLHLRESRKFKKRKVRRAAYGPGPFGMYGTDAGYSGVAEGLFGIDDKIKGRIQNIVSDLSDIPGMWDHQRQTFTDAGMEKLKSALKNNPKYIKYALNLTYKDYEAEGVTEEFGPLPRDNQQIQLGKYTVELERVGMNKNYIGFTWHDSRGQGHYEEVPVGDLGSYDDLKAKIKDEIRYQERKIARQGVAEGWDESFSPDELSILNQYLDDEISWQELKRGYSDLVRKAIKHFDVVSMSSAPIEFQFYDRLVQARDEGDLGEQGVAENFADGRNPQDKGDSKRHGVPTKASVSTLRKVAKQGGRKGQLAHWMANMKAGRAKKK